MSESKRPTTMDEREITVPTECSEWVRLCSGYKVGYDTQRIVDDNGNVFYRFKLERVI